MATPTLRKRIWGWYFFDFASQPYHTVLNTFIFGPFFGVIALAYFLDLGFEPDLAKAKSQSVWAWSTAFYGLIIAFLAPIFGAIADSTGRKMPWIVGFSVMYVFGASMLWFTDPGASNLYLMLVCFGVGFIGGEFALIFTNAMLPGLGTRDEIGKISGSGFAFGYFGGVIALLIALLLLVAQGNGKTLIGIEPLFGLDPSAKEGTRATGPMAAIWYVVFMIPFFMWVREVRTDKLRVTFVQAIGSVARSIKGLAHRKSLGFYLVASMFYRDALNGLYTFGGFYAAIMMDWGITQIGVFGVVAAVGASVFSYVGGGLDRRFGPKPVILVCIVLLTLVSFTLINLTPTAIFGIQMAPGVTDMIFTICGVLIGGFGGMLQSTSRSLMVRHCNEDTATEYFGLYGLSGRATAFMAPLFIGFVTTMTGSVRLGVSPVIALFLVGLVLLAWVNAKGDQA